MYGLFFTDKRFIHSLKRPWHIFGCFAKYDECSTFLSPELLECTPKSRKGFHEYCCADIEAVDFETTIIDL